MIDCQLGNLTGEARRAVLDGRFADAVDRLILAAEGHAQAGKLGDGDFLIGALHSHNAVNHLKIVG